MILKTILFVPGDRADRFPKAVATDASVVCIDLEDAVAADNKIAAREAALAFLDENDGARLAVRINPLDSVVGLEDLLAIAAAKKPPRYVLLPKISAVAEVRLADKVLSASRVLLIPLVESVDGVADAMQIASEECCFALAFGGGDYASELGVGMEWEALLLARLTVVQACARAGAQAIDVPFIGVDDAELERETSRIKALGFTGKIAIHPRQVGVINRVFTPNAAEIARAKAALAAFDAAGRAATLFEGRLLEAPLVRGFQRTLAAASSGDASGD
jgi:(S)-citramalyl-CoA lyase